MWAGSGYLQVAHFSPHLFTLSPAWVTASAILVETSTEMLQGIQGKSVILPCNYNTTSPDRNGFILWTKLLRSHTEKVFTWVFERKEAIFGERYVNRVKLSGDPAQSDAAIIIDQLTMDDNGTYECSVSLISDMTGMSQSRTQLLVLYSSTSQNIIIYLVAGGIVVGAIILGLIIYFCQRNRNRNQEEGSAKEQRKIYRESPDELDEINVVSRGRYEDDDYERREEPGYGHADEPGRRPRGRLTSSDCDE
ncbi:Cell surface A33 antigen [Galemys pyrenaicus]|uniref:Cell surface A33 antigen n=1 Tax=Galemys pyrenaicus TaxID=202257 RepID=A0A8J6AAD3_GALPY|nr:Cell surface A33 antigen [Galemys pyrenaicus]